LRFIMASPLRSFVAAVAVAVRAEDGAALAALLSADRGDVAAALAGVPPATVASSVASAFPPGSSDDTARAMGKVLAAHLAAVGKAAEAAAAAVAAAPSAAASTAPGAGADPVTLLLETAFDAEHEALKEFLHVVADCGTNWVVRPLLALVWGAWRLGSRLEAALDATGQRDAATGRIVSGCARRGGVGKRVAAVGWLDCALWEAPRVVALVRQRAPSRTHTRTHALPRTAHPSPLRRTRWRRRCATPSRTR
jgi:hypothetical protein